MINGQIGGLHFEMYEEQKDAGFFRISPGCLVEWSQPKKGQKSLYM
jgi:hypothetical protein